MPVMVLSWTETHRTTNAYNSLGNHDIGSTEEGSGRGASQHRGVLRWGDTRSSPQSPIDTNIMLVIDANMPTRRARAKCGLWQLWVVHTRTMVHHMQHINVPGAHRTLCWCDNGRRCMSIHQRVATLVAIRRLNTAYQCNSGATPRRPQLEYVGLARWQGPKREHAALPTMTALHRCTPVPRGRTTTAVAVHCQHPERRVANVCGLRCKPTHGVRTCKHRSTDCGATRVHKRRGVKPPLPQSQDCATDGVTTMPKSETMWGTGQRVWTPIGIWAFRAPHQCGSRHPQRKPKAGFVGQKVRVPRSTNTEPRKAGPSGPPTPVRLPPGHPLGHDDHPDGHQNDPPEK